MAKAAFSKKKTLFTSKMSCSFFSFLVGLRTYQHPLYLRHSVPWGYRKRKQKGHLKFFKESTSNRTRNLPTLQFLQLVIKGKGKRRGLDGNFKSVCFTSSAHPAVEFHWGFHKTRVKKCGGWQKSRIYVIRTTCLEYQNDLKT